MAIDQLLLYAIGRLFLSVVFGSPTADTDEDQRFANEVVEKLKKERKNGGSSPEARLAASASNIKKVTCTSVLQVPARACARFSHTRISLSRRVYALPRRHADIQLLTVTYWAASTHAHAHEHMVE